MPVRTRQSLPGYPLPAGTERRLRIATPADCRFHLTEQLLEARRGSWLPTNGAGPDEDVNIYLALRLEALVTAAPDPRVVPGPAPLAPGPDPALGRAARADWYRANGDHRLLHLGLFDRGDASRRRGIPWGWTRGQARARDLAVAAACYQAAAHLWSRGPGAGKATSDVMAKLAVRCEDYVHVLTALAVRRLGLGAHLSDADLADLANPAPPAAEAVGSAVGTAVGSAVGTMADVDALIGTVPAGAIDVLLDLALEYRRFPDAALRARIERLAPLAGFEASALLGRAATRPAT